MFYQQNRMGFCTNSSSIDPHLLLWQVNDYNVTNPTISSPIRAILDGVDSPLIIVAAFFSGLAMGIPWRSLVWATSNSWLGDLLIAKNWTFFWDMLSLLISFIREQGQTKRTQPDWEQHLLTAWITRTCPKSRLHDWSTPFGCPKRKDCHDHRQCRCRGSASARPWRKMAGSLWGGVFLHGFMGFMGF